MDKRQTEFVLKLLSILDDSLALNRHLIKTCQSGPMNQDDYQKAMESLDRIDQRFTELKIKD